MLLPCFGTRSKGLNRQKLSSRFVFIGLLLSWLLLIFIDVVWHVTPPPPPHSLFASRAYSDAIDTQVKAGMEASKRLSVVFGCIIRDANPDGVLPPRVDAVVALAQTFASAKIIFVENDSSDGTAEVLRAAAAAHPTLITAHTFKKHEVAAITHGSRSIGRYRSLAYYRDIYLKEMLQSNADLFIVFDGDLSITASTVYLSALFFVPDVMKAVPVCAPPAACRALLDHNDSTKPCPAALLASSSLAQYLGSTVSPTGICANGVVNRGVMWDALAFQSHEFLDTRHDMTQLLAAQKVYRPADYIFQGRDAQQVNLPLDQCTPDGQDTDQTAPRSAGPFDGDATALFRRATPTHAALLPVGSCFGGVALYNGRHLRAANCTTSDAAVPMCEHFVLHSCLRSRNPKLSLFMNPVMVVYYPMRFRKAVEAALPSIAFLTISLAMGAWCFISGLTAPGYAVDLSAFLRRPSLRSSHVLAPLLYIVFVLFFWSYGRS